MALCDIVMMHRCLAERHVRPSVWLQRNTDGRDVEGGYHQSSALGQYLRRCCLDYEDLTLEVPPSPLDAYQLRISGHPCNSEMSAIGFPQIECRDRW